MPNRIVREAMLSSERVASLGWPDEVFYRRLMSIVDDYGRHEANHQLLRAKCYPLQTDSVRVADIARWMAACQKSGLILVYGVNGKQYLEIANFGQQIRAASKCPEPPSDSKCDQLLANEHLGVSVVVSVSEGVDTPPKRGKPKKHPMPDDFALSDRVKRWAAEKGHGRLPERFEHFVGAARARGYEYADWDEALMNAIRDDWAKFGTDAASQPGGGRKRL